MRYIKTYEDLIEPEVGDYVICEEAGFYEKDLINFINNNVGKIVEHERERLFPYKIEYKNIPHIISNKFEGGLRSMKTHEIIKFSKSREELEDFLAASKYNI